MNCICGQSEATELFRAGGNPVLQCPCGQVRVEIDEPPSYSFDYFSAKNSYYARQDEFLEVFDDLLDLVERHASPARLLDVGTGSGLLLVAASRRGWDASGVEYSVEAATFAREQGLAVSPGDVLSVNGAEDYDVVIFNHVIEHLPDPVRDLRYAKTLLRAGGLLVIGVPNFGSWMARLRKGNWASLKPDEHYWQFTKETLLQAIEPLELDLLGFATNNYVIKRPRSLKDLLYKAQSPVTLALNNGEAMTLVLTDRRRPRDTPVRR